MNVRTILLAAACGLAAPAGAETLGDVATLEVLEGWRMPSGQHMAAVRVRLAPGWKTYWRSPGDAGIPPYFDFHAAENMAAVAWHWPVPKVFHANGMRSVGYAGELVLPVEITPNGSGEVRFAGTVQIGVCEEICIPAMFDFDALLPSGGVRDPAIVAALVDRPLTAEEAGVGQVACEVIPMADGLRLSAEIEVDRLGASEAAVVEAGPGIWVSDPSVERSGDRLVVTADLAAQDGPVVLDRSAVRVTVLAEGTGVDIRGCPAG